MRICVIGPSHLAALREAHKQGLVDTRGHEISYMGHRSWIYRSIAFDGEKLYFDAPHGDRPLADDLNVEVRIADYDVLFFHAAVRRLSLLISDRSGPIDLGAYSSGMQKQIATGIIRKLGGFDMLERVRAAFDGPILLSGKPEHAAPEDEAAAEAGHGDRERTMRVVTEAFAGLGFHFIPQPMETVLNGRFTRREYSVGSVALGETRTHKKEDVHHMNERYGALVFDTALDAVARLAA
jgi:hypothetical protein